MLDKIIAHNQEYLPIVVSKKPQQITVKPRGEITDDLGFFLEGDGVKYTGMTIRRYGNDYTTSYNSKMTYTSDFCINGFIAGKATGEKLYHVKQVMTADNSSVTGWISSYYLI